MLDNGEVHGRHISYRQVSAFFWFFANQYFFAVGPRYGQKRKSFDPDTVLRQPLAQQAIVFACGV